MEYIRIKDWDKFQHYKKRNPPWIKLHVSLLDNEAFECLHNDSKVLLICLFLFAARKGNGEVPANIDYLQRKLPIGKKIKLQPLIEAGFIECYQDDSKVPHIESKYLCAETETEAETEAETEQSQRHNKKKFIPPTLEDVKQYIKENPELNNLDAYDVWKGYNDGGWIDTQGKPVRNWKLKLRTRSSYAGKRHQSPPTAGGNTNGKYNIR